MPVGTDTLLSAESFTGINNRSQPTIRGTSGNLPDYSTITAGNNPFAVNCEGGHGNALTLP